MANTKKTYGEKLKHPKWQMRRLKIMERDGAMCTMCGCKERTLNIHHKKYTGENPWDAPDEDLTTVCSFCHKIIEEGKKGGLDVFHIIILDDEDCRMVFVFSRNSDGINVVGCFGFDDNFNVEPTYVGLRKETVKYCYDVMKNKEHLNDAAFKIWISNNKYLPHRQPKTELTNG